MRPPVLALALPLAFLAACSPVPSAAPGASGQALSGRVLVPASLGAGDVQVLISHTGVLMPPNTSAAFRVAAAGTGEAPLAGALVTLTTPDGQALADSRGNPLYALTDAAGAYRFDRLAAGTATVVSVPLSGDRRLAAFAVVGAGTPSADVTLASTYATELLTQEAAYAGRPLASYDPVAFARLVARTETDVLAGKLGLAPDLRQSDGAARVAEYGRVVGAVDQALSDGWAALLGARPVTLATLPMGLAADRQPGQLDLAAAADVRVAGAAVPGAGTLYALDQTASTTELRALVTAADGSTTSVQVDAGTRTPGGYLARPVGLAMETKPDGSLSGRVFYFDGSTPAAAAVLGFDPAGPATFSFAIAPTVVGSTVPWSASAIRDAAFDAGGNLYVVDQANERVMVLSLNGGGVFQATLVAGTGQRGFAGDGGNPLLATFRDLSNVAWYKGVLYLSDAGNHRVRALDLTAQTITTLAGAADPGQLSGGGATATLIGGFGGDGGPASAALLDGPRGLAAAHVAGADRLFVADAGNRRIRAIDLTAGSHPVTTVAGGPGTPGGDGDARHVVLGVPQALAIDRDGDLAVVEGQRVRQVYTRFGF